MENSQESPSSKVQISIAMPSFIVKLWNMVNNPDTDDIISWNNSGNAFIIHDQIIFYTTLLPMYYKHNNMTSFVRQLNLYGFHKVPNCQNQNIEFYHAYFQKDEPELLQRIKRKTAASRFKSSLAVTKSEDLQKVICEVKQIKDKQDSVDDQLEQLQQENAAMWYELNDLRVKHKKQTQVVNKLVQFLINFVQPNIEDIRTSKARTANMRRGGATIFEVDGDVGASEYWKRYDQQMITGKDSGHIQSPTPPDSKMIENHARETHKDTSKIKSENLSLINYNSPDRILNEIYSLMLTNQANCELSDVKPKRLKTEAARSTEMNEDTLLDLLEQQLMENAATKQESNQEYIYYPAEEVDDNIDQQHPAIDYKVSGKPDIVSSGKKISDKPGNSDYKMSRKPVIVSSGKQILYKPGNSSEIVSYTLSEPSGSNKRKLDNTIIQTKPANKIVKKHPLVAVQSSSNGQTTVTQKASRPESIVQYKQLNKNSGNKSKKQVLVRNNGDGKSKHIILNTRRKKQPVKYVPVMMPKKVTTQLMPKKVTTQLMLKKETTQLMPKQGSVTEKVPKATTSSSDSATNSDRSNLVTTLDSDAMLQDLSSILEATTSSAATEGTVLPDQQPDTAKRKSGKSLLTGETLGLHVQNMENDLNNLKDFLNTYDIDPNCLLDMFANVLDDNGEIIGEVPVKSEIGELSLPPAVEQIPIKSEILSSNNSRESANYNLDTLDVNLPFDDCDEIQF